MSKKIRISESQLRNVVKNSLNEEVEGNIVTSFGNSVIDSILKGGTLYDKDCPNINLNKPTLLANLDDYEIYVVGDTDSEPSVSKYYPGDYYTPPEGGDIIWNPKKFYPVYVDILKKGGENINDEYNEALSDYIVEKLSEINIDNKYEIVINTEDVENDDYGIDPYDNINDR